MNRPSPAPAAEERYWLLVHGGEVHAVTWDVGEQLLALSAQVCSGVAESQPFTFLPRGAAQGATVTLTVRADQPLDLITAYPESAVAKHPPAGSPRFGSAASGAS